jgi:hypothetical protein
MGKKKGKGKVVPSAPTKQRRFKPGSAGLVPMENSDPIEHKTIFYPNSLEDPDRGIFVTLSPHDSDDEYASERETPATLADLETTAAVILSKLRELAERDNDFRKRYLKEGKESNDLAAATKTAVGKAENELALLRADNIALREANAELLLATQANTKAIEELVALIGGTAPFGPHRKGYPGVGALGVGMGQE